MPEKPLEEFNAPSVLGEVRKEEGMERAKEAVPDWATQARKIMLVLGLAGPVTSEDVTNVVGLPRSAIGTNQNNAVGAVVSDLARGKFVERIDYVKSSNPQGHAAVISRWRLTEKGRLAAEALRTKTPQSFREAVVVRTVDALEREVNYG